MMLRWYFSEAGVPFVAVSQRLDPWRWTTNTCKGYKKLPPKEKRKYVRGIVCFHLQLDYA